MPWRVANDLKKYSVTAIKNSLQDEAVAMLGRS